MWLGLGKAGRVHALNYARRPPHDAYAVAIFRGRARLRRAATLVVRTSSQHRPAGTPAATPHAGDGPHAGLEARYISAGRTADISGPCRRYNGGTG